MKTLITVRVEYSKFCDEKGWDPYSVEISMFGEYETTINFVTRKQAENFAKSITLKRMKFRKAKR